MLILGKKKNNNNNNKSITRLYWASAVVPVEGSGGLGETLLTVRGQGRNHCPRCKRGSRADPPYGSRPAPRGGGAKGSERYQNRCSSPLRGEASRCLRGLSELKADLDFPAPQTHRKSGASRHLKPGNERARKTHIYCYCLPCYSATHGLCFFSSWNFTVGLLASKDKERQLSG